MASPATAPISGLGKAMMTGTATPANPEGNEEHAVQDRRRVAPLAFLPRLLRGADRGHRVGNVGGVAAHQAVEHAAHADTMVMALTGPR